MTGGNNLSGTSTEEQNKHQPPSDKTCCRNSAKDINDCDKKIQQKHVQQELDTGYQDSASQYVGEREDISNENGDLYNSAHLQEVTDDLRQVSAALKSALHSSDNSIHNSDSE